MAKKKVVLSEGAIQVLEFLKEVNGELTFAQIKENVPNANVSHLGVFIISKHNLKVKGIKW